MLLLIDQLLSIYDASENEAISLQPVVAGQAYMPHMKAMSLPFLMPY